LAIIITSELLAYLIESTMATAVATKLVAHPVVESI
jgi:hypothetical protein